MTVSVTYGSAHTFRSITSDLSFSDVENEIRKINNFINSFDSSFNNKIEFSTDYSTAKVRDRTLEDELLDITNDYSATIYLLSEIERVIGENKSYLDTESMIYKIKSNDTFNIPNNYVYTLDKSWLTIDKIYHVYSYSDVCNINSYKFGCNKNNVNHEEFTKNAIDVYEHIQFNEVFLPKLATIKRGDLSHYLFEFSHALNVLNQAYFIISSDDNKNEEDLVKISELSHQLGRTLACTPQAKNKPHFDFYNYNRPISSKDRNGNEKITYPKEQINCEYHLKLNFNDKNIKLPDDYNRAYFGLKYCDITKKKYIKLAYIGEHWPPEVGGKKRN
ncbi:hypothetical protein [Aliivibrio fischeri]|uniref:hypothetical protein n=1 Tax=Aliivibrio fischeri TaxID=668 RepID=UPI0037357E62